MLAWALFFIYRKSPESDVTVRNIPRDPNFFLGIFIIPTGWVLLYSIFDHYVDIYRLSRLTTLTRTFFLTFFGVIFLFLRLFWTMSGTTRPITDLFWRS